MQSISQRIAGELNAQEWQVKAAIDLLDGGSTVPFIARYRKEVTGDLDDTQLRTLDERLRYLRELEDRRKAILDSIREQGKLTDELLAQINARRHQGAARRPLSALQAQAPHQGADRPRSRARAARRRACSRPVAATRSARPPPSSMRTRTWRRRRRRSKARARILVERFAEHAELLGALRDIYWQRGTLTSTVRDGKATEGAKFADYFDFAEPLTKLPSHRILAMFRGEKEEILDLALGRGQGQRRTRLCEPVRGPHRDDLRHRRPRPARRQLAARDACGWAWRTKLALFASSSILQTRLWQLAEDEAVKVFAGNLRDLLLAAPAGSRPTLGLDPGFRTGVKVAVVDATGKVVATDTIYPHEPQPPMGRARSRSSPRFAAPTRSNWSRSATARPRARPTSSRPNSWRKHPESEAHQDHGVGSGRFGLFGLGLASQELPDLDVSLRGAVSIARRLQDPLAELVKIDPKSIGVGQYQHDLSELKLSRSLDAVVEDCVNAVGVDVNTASAPLLARVSGLGECVAQNIVAHRDAERRRSGPARR